MESVLLLHVNFLRAMMKLLLLLKALLKLLLNMELRLRVIDYFLLFLMQLVHMEVELILGLMMKKMQKNIYNSYQLRN